MSTLIYGHDDIFLEWAQEKNPSGVSPVGNNWTLGIIDDAGYPIGAITITQTSPCGVEVGAECINGLNRQVIRDTFAYIFGFLGASRCELVTKRTNKVIKKHAPNTLGFRFEGVRRDWYGPGEDGLAFYMTPQTCKWIETDEHEQRTERRHPSQTPRENQRTRGGTRRQMEPN